MDCVRGWVLALAGIGNEPDAKEKLRRLGAKATAPLIEALSNPAFLAELPDDSPLTKNALDDVFDLLRAIAPPEAVPPLCTLVGHHDKRRIRMAALLLGCIADPGGVPALARALQHEDDYVRSYALMGLAEARSKGRGSQAFWTGVYPHLIPLIDRDDASISDVAPKLVVSIEPTRGLELLLDQYCTKKNRRLSYAIAAARTTSGEVPVAIMDRLLADLAPDCASYPWTYAMAELLRLMASKGHPRAEHLANKYFHHRDERIREGAADALVVLRGMADPASVAFDAVEHGGYSALTLAQRAVYCVRCLVDEVNNGGLAQYLGNSSGDHAMDAI